MSVFADDSVGYQSQDLVAQCEASEKIFNNYYEACKAFTQGTLPLVEFIPVIISFYENLVQSFNLEFITHYAKEQTVSSILRLFQKSFRMFRNAPKISVIITKPEFENVINFFTKDMHLFFSCVFHPHLSDSRRENLLEMINCLQHFIFDLPSLSGNLHTETPLVISIDSLIGLLVKSPSGSVLRDKIYQLFGMFFDLESSEPIRALLNTEDVEIIGELLAHAHKRGVVNKIVSLVPHTKEKALVFCDAFSAFLLLSQSFKLTEHCAAHLAPLFTVSLVTNETTLTEANDIEAMRCLQTCLEYLPHSESLHALVTVDYDMTALLKALLPVLGPHGIKKFLLPKVETAMRSFVIDGPSGDATEQEIVSLLRETCSFIYGDKAITPTFQLAVCLVRACTVAILHGYIDTELFYEVIAIVMKTHGNIATFLTEIGNTVRSVHELTVAASRGLSHIFESLSQLEVDMVEITTCFLLLDRSTLPCKLLLPFFLSHDTVFALLNGPAVLSMVHRLGTLISDDDRFTAKQYCWLLAHKHPEPNAAAAVVLHDVSILQELSDEDFVLLLQKCPPSLLDDSIVMSVLNHRDEAVRARMAAAVASHVFLRDDMPSVVAEALKGLVAHGEAGLYGELVLDAINAHVDKMQVVAVAVEPIVSVARATPKLLSQCISMLLKVHSTSKLHDALSEPGQHVVNGLNSLARDITDRLRAYLSNITPALLSTLSDMNELSWSQAIDTLISDGLLKRTMLGGITHTNTIVLDKQEVTATDLELSQQCLLMGDVMQAIRFGHRVNNAFFRSHLVQTANALLFKPFNDTELDSKRSMFAGLDQRLQNYMEASKLLQVNLSYAIEGVIVGAIGWLRGLQFFEGEDVESVIDEIVEKCAVYNLTINKGFDFYRYVDAQDIQL
ncbi:hypothetical protein PCE1_000358 [Barthelona sp. PCE]